MKIIKASLPLSDHHPETSHRMKADVFPRTKTHRQRVYDELAKKPRTCDEMNWDLGWEKIASRCSSTFSTLAKDGLIEPTGERRKTRNGQLADVYRAVPLN